MRNSSLLFLLFITSTIFSCREKADDSKAVYVGPKSELFGIDMVYSDSARKVVRMVTEEQLTLSSEDRVYPKEMKLWFYDKTGKITSEVRGIQPIFIAKKTPTNSSVMWSSTTSKKAKH